MALHLAKRAPAIDLDDIRDQVAELVDDPNIAATVRLAPYADAIEVSLSRTVTVSRAVLTESLAFDPERMLELEIDLAVRGLKDEYARLAR